MDRKRVHVIGGATVEPVRSHMALTAYPGFGTTARRLATLCRDHNQTMDVILTLTKIADPARSSIVTHADLAAEVARMVADPRTKIIFFNASVMDFSGEIGNVPSGKYSPRLSSGDVPEGGFVMSLAPLPKIISTIRRERKDIFLVGFKTTTGATEEEQFRAGLNLLKEASCNLVLANDTLTRVNMIIVPEEAPYHVTTDRESALKNLVEMAYLRSHLTFTRSTIVAGEPVSWESDLVPESLRTVVNFCIEQGAYKRFRGVTAGHFAVRLDDQTFLTSRRKTDFNDMKNVGLVKVQTDGPDSVIAYGSKPSVGGQSQRIVFGANPGLDCIVHFHCPILPGSKVPTVSQREFECGSHECGSNTARGLAEFGNLKAVYLDHHGPNIVFAHSTDPQEVINFIQANFDLTQKTSGYAIG